MMIKFMISMMTKFMISCMMTKFMISCMMTKFMMIFSDKFIVSMMINICKKSFGLVLIYDKPDWFGSKLSVNSLAS